MIRISNIKMEVGHNKKELKQRAAKMLKVKPDAFTAFEIRKQSVDARKKPVLYYVYTVDVEIPGEKRILEKSRCRQASLEKREEYRFVEPGTETGEGRIVIIGSGPAGLFCGYLLAKPAEDITAGDVLRATEGSCAPVACLEDGAEACPRRGECVAVNFWRGLDRTIEGYVDGVTLADLVKMG